MNRTLRIVHIIGLLGATGPAFGSGLIPGLLDRDPLRASLATRNSAGLNSASLAQPTGIHTDSASITLEFTAENLLRTRTNGKLTADISTWGKAESIFLPLRIANRPTTFAMSHFASNASAYYSSSGIATNLAWASNTYAWAVNHSIGPTKIGIASSRDSGQAPGTSDYPQDIFRIFQGSTPVSFNLDGRSSLIQVAQALPANAEICVAAGAGTTSLCTQLGRASNIISIPARADTTSFGIDLAKPISKKLNMSAGFTRSTGSGSNFIYRNDHREGKLRYEPQYHQFSASIRYQKSLRSLWEVGFVSSQWDTRLHGISLKGNDLGIGTSFNDLIDFNANAGLSVSFLHVGQQRRVSDKWRLGWRYKLVRMKSDVNGDYVGRDLIGFIPIYATGNYDNSLLATRLHDLELSAQYVRKAVAFEMRIEQIVPAGSGGGKSASADPTPSGPKDQRKSIGGTSFSLTSSYAF